MYKVQRLNDEYITREREGKLVNIILQIRWMRMDSTGFFKRRSRRRSDIRRYRRDNGWNNIRIERNRINRNIRNRVRQDRTRRWTELVPRWEEATEKSGTGLELGTKGGDCDVVGKEDTKGIGNEKLEEKEKWYIFMKNHISSNEALFRL